jgi:hypothetical protein
VTISSGVQRVVWWGGAAQALLVIAEAMAVLILLCI